MLSGTRGAGAAGQGTQQEVLRVGVGKGAGQQELEGKGHLFVVSRAGRRSFREHFTTTVCFRRAWCRKTERGPCQPGTTPGFNTSMVGVGMCA